MKERKPNFALAADLSRSGGEGRQLSIVTTGFGLGIALGPLIAGVLGTLVFELPFIIGGALTMVGVWIVYRYVPETVQRGESVAARNHWRRVLHMTGIERGTNEIVVAQDGSPAALAAAGIAIQIAQSQDLSVHGLYVVDETLVLDTYANYRREVESDVELTSRAELMTWFEEEGDAALQRLEVRCQAAGVPVTAELVAGGVPEMVLRESERARLLAIGRRGHGHEGDPHHLGRSFRTIAHRAHVPLVIGGGEERTVRRLLLAYDGVKHAQPALVWASSLQRTLSAEVVVVAVQENGLQSTSEWLAEAQAQLAGCQCLHRLGQPAGEILAAAEETQADLIVMGCYRHTALLERLKGSIVDRVLRGTQLPVLMA